MLIKWIMLTINLLCVTN